jgi:hypothetical protein
MIKYYLGSLIMINYNAYFHVGTLRPRGVQPVFLKEYKFENSYNSDTCPRSSANRNN